MLFRKRKPDYDDINREDRVAREDLPLRERLRISVERQKLDRQRHRSKMEQAWREGRLREEDFLKIVSLIDQAASQQDQMDRKTERVLQSMERNEEFLRQVNERRRRRFLEWLVFDQPWGGADLEW